MKGFEFELKGGTSLSKGFNFSEGIDIQIHPGKSTNVKTAKNHNKPTNIKNRENFFNRVADQLNIADMQFSRGHFH